MDVARFDRWTRTYSTTSSRRQALTSLVLGTIMARFAPNEAAAGPGCKNVGQKCQKKKDCCSGICKGKKGKKKCKAHDSGGCQPAETPGPNGACTTSTGEMGTCLTTTGNAGYCANDGECFPCIRDADCRPYCGAQAACVRSNFCLAGACFGPSGSSCNFMP